MLKYDSEDEDSLDLDDQGLDAVMARHESYDAEEVALGLVPWDAPGFTVRDHARRLHDLEASAPITVRQRRFRIYATKE
ncbi:hypothetical protein SANBI_002704 [Sanguibacter sp. 4.1]|uniref:Uncharacterized protein n=1 Tax=Sanguibacter biliveldensis TaxID=3030830 RepID=A0AAF1C1T6_9MICO|nr:hypothetical protein [Sanguibacter sp. 4.1]WPF81410.1 hypothetical protein SANBI_002704 [Sanguibacter sp. 4.1]